MFSSWFLIRRKKKNKEGELKERERKESERAAACAAALPPAFAFTPRAAFCPAGQQRAMCFRWPSFVFQEEVVVHRAFSLRLPRCRRRDRKRGRNAAFFFLLFSFPFFHPRRGRRRLRFFSSSRLHVPQHDADERRGVVAHGRRERGGGGFCLGLLLLFFLSPSVSFFFWPFRPAKRGA